MAETTFEKLAIALEAARGTAEAAPTHILPLSGVMTPREERYKPEERSRGTLAGRYRSVQTRRWVEWDGDGGMDPNILPLLLRMALENGVTPTQPDAANAPNTYLWTFTRVMSQNVLETGTLWWGDPNLQTFQSAFGFVQELSLVSDATGTDGSTMSASGLGARETKVAAPAYPALDIGSLIVPGDLQVWLDTGADPIGTTEVTGRVLRAEHTIPTGLMEKFRPQGPGGNRTYDKLGVQEVVPETTVMFEFDQTGEYDHFDQGTAVKLRVRHNGAFIEDDGVGTDYYEYVEIDAYGKLEAPEWGEYADTNRTLTLTLEHEYSSVLGSDIEIKVENQVSSL